MRRVAIGLALVALVGLAACTETSPSSEPRTKNAALVTTTTTTPASTTSQTTTTATTTTTTTTTTNVPTTTSPAKQPTCTISWDGAQFTACKQFRELRYEHFGANGPLRGQLTKPNLRSSSNISLSALQGSKSVRISIPFLDGSAVSDVDVAIGATVDVRFSVLPTPTTAPSGEPGCDISVRYAAITPTCGLRISSYTYQWHDGVKTISGTMVASFAKLAPRWTQKGVKVNSESTDARSNGGWQTVLLGTLPKGATGALMTFVFSNGQKTRSVLIPLTAPNTITVRALY
jgi:hypothetical protein